MVINKRVFIMHITEVLIVWPALLMMNETEDGKLPEWRKLAMGMFCNYLLSLSVNYLVRVVEHPAIKLIHVPFLLLSLLICCTLFTGGVVKIFLSMLISDLWGGVGEILMTIVYCIICGKDLEFIFLPRYEGDILLQWIVEVVVGVSMLFITRPLFHKYKKLPIFESRIFAILILFYFAVGYVWTIRPLGLLGSNVSPYYYSLIFIVVFSCIFILFLGYNQKKLMDAKIQSLYLKQKMEQEYSLVFEDMDKDIRRFRHDVKKHMGHLTYLAENCAVRVPAAQLEAYQKDLKNIYEELTYGNYCSKYDVNMVLVQMEKECRKQNADIRVSLKNLDLDSLSVYLRVQMFEILSDWVGQELEIERLDFTEEKRLFSLSGTSSAGFHSLKLALQWTAENYGTDMNENKLKKMQRCMKREVSFKNVTGKLRKLLYEHGSAVKLDKKDGKILLTVSWHGSVPQD